MNISEMASEDLKREWLESEECVKFSPLQDAGELEYAIQSLVREGFSFHVLYLENESVWFAQFHKANNTHSAKNDDFRRAILEAAVLAARAMAEKESAR